MKLFLKMSAILLIMTCLQGCGAIENWVADKAEKIAIEKALSITEDYLEVSQEKIDEDLDEAFAKFQESEEKNKEVFDLLTSSVKDSLKDAIAQIPLKMKEGASFTEAAKQVAAEEGVELKDLIISIVGTFILSGYAGKQWGQNKGVKIAKEIQRGPLVS